MKSIVFLGTKAIGYDCLQYLLEKKQELNAEVIAISTKENTALDKGKSILHLAKKHQIKTLDKLAQIPDCDLIISVQFHKILKAKHIQKARQLAINLHIAPLPEYRGCNQFSFAIADDAKEFGPSIHRLETSIDGGDILFEKRFPIPPNCFVQELYNISYQHSITLFQAHIADIINGNYTPIPQADLLATRGTSYHFRTEINELKKIDLSWDKEKIERHFRATYFPPFEPPYAIINGQKVYFSLKEEVK